MKSLLKYFKAIVLMMALLVVSSSYGQGYWGTWNNFNILSHVNKNLSFYFEGQVRATKLVKNYNYYEMNLSAGYTIAPKTEVQFGLGKIETLNPEGFFKRPEQNAESRIWEQISFANAVGIVKMDHRYRIEQQFTTGGYHNRFRYRLNFNVPLLKKGETSTLYFNTSDEIFLRDKDPLFNQNRLYIGAGCPVTKRLSVQAGWMRVGEQSAQHIIHNRNFLLTSLISDLSFKKKEHL